MNTDLIGTFSDTRLACGDEHLPAAYNPMLNRTWCVCGERQWAGRTDVTWHCREITRPLPGLPPMPHGVGLGAPGMGRRREVIGYDIYTLKGAIP